MTKKTDPKGHSTTFQYNIRGDLISVIDALGQQTTYSYDAKGRKIAETRPSILNGAPFLRQITYAYDDAGRLITETHVAAGGENRTIHFEYDGFDRVTKKTLAKGSQIEDETIYTYEPQLDANLLASANNSVANLGFSNEATPPFAITSYSVAAAESGNPKGLIEDTFTINRDVTGNIAGVTGSTEGSIFSKAYDPAGRLIGFASGTFKGALQYDGFGRRENISFSDGLTGNFSYDSLNRIRQINWKEKYKDSVRQHLTYDLAGNVSHMAREHSTYDLSYDAVDQLVGSRMKGLQGVPNYTKSWELDALGSRVGDSHSNTLSEFVSNFLTRNGQSSFTADPDGLGQTAQEITGDKTKNYTYRADGKLATYQSGNLSVSYHYDGLGRLVAKAVNDGASQYTQAFTYLSSSKKVLLGKAGDGSVTTYIDGQGVADRLGEVKNGVGRAYITDHLGSVLNSGPAGSSRSFGLFGESSSMPNISMTASPVVYGFTGHFVDVESGLNRTEFRMYDPKVGRWLSQEPLGIDGPNLYWYGRNSPVVNVDPSGLYAFPQHEGASPINSDEGVQMLVNSYLNESGGNVDQAWTQSVYERMNGYTVGEAAALTEHYLYARNEVACGGYSAAAQQAILIPGYTSVKAIEQSIGQYVVTNPDASPASRREIQWGYKGIYDGINDR